MNQEEGAAKDVATTNGQGGNRPSGSRQSVHSQSDQLGKRLHITNLLADSSDVDASEQAQDCSQPQTVASTTAESADCKQTSDHVEIVDDQGIDRAGVALQIDNRLDGGKEDSAMTYHHQRVPLNNPDDPQSAMISSGGDDQRGVGDQRRWQHGQSWNSGIDRQKERQQQILAQNQNAVVRPTIPSIRELHLPSVRPPFYPTPWSENASSQQSSSDQQQYFSHHPNNPPQDQSSSMSFQNYVVQQQQLHQNPRWAHPNRRYPGSLQEQQQQHHHHHPPTAGMIYRPPPIYDGNSQSAPAVVFQQSPFLISPNPSIDTHQQQEVHPIRIPQRIADDQFRQSPHQHMPQSIQQQQQHQYQHQYQQERQQSLQHVAGYTNNISKSPKRQITEHRREKNREAALRYRQKQVERKETLEKRLGDLMNQNQSLTGEVDELNRNIGALNAAIEEIDKTCKGHHSNEEN
ncbi:hypothetical protein MP228_008589 [Amoeboaphelidium protococcarum]|nr:hypothetical protein MP228_008589 [Amoeboaphelidium protococcarum]